jgi:hypothetical protein
MLGERKVLTMRWAVLQQSRIVGPNEILWLIYIYWISVRMYETNHALSIGTYSKSHPT